MQKEYTPVKEDFTLLPHRDLNTDTNFASQSYWKGVAIHFFKNRRAVIGLVIITLIAAFLQNFAQYPVVQHAFAGIRVCVCVLIFNAVLKLWKKAVVDKVSRCLYIGVFLMTALSGVLPVAVPAAILVITSGILGVIIGGFRDNNDNKKEAEKKS